MLLRGKLSRKMKENDDTIEQWWVEKQHGKHFSSSGFFSTVVIVVGTEMASYLISHREQYDKV